MRQVRLFVTASVFLVVLLSGATLRVDGGGSRCTDHCADRYRIAKDACDLIPFKHERKICERRAKEAKNDCKHRCH